MSIYHLSYDEAWTLATALRLPVQKDSALADWLYSGEVPDLDQVAAQSLGSLAAKGYYRGPNAAEPFTGGLLRSLALISVNAATLSAVIRTNGRSSLVRFAQVGPGVAQVGMDESGLHVHDVGQASGLAGTLLPAWFAPGWNDGLRDELPLGAFLLFSHACNLEDWASARADFQTESFAVKELLETFQRGSGWLDAFSAVGVPGVPMLAQLPLNDYLNHLVAKGYLVAVGQGFLAIGPAGKPVAAALTAADSCTLTLTLQLADSAEVPSGAFVHGGGRLLFVEIVSGVVRFQQLADLDSGRAWIARLLEQGSRARYAEYVIPEGEAGSADAAVAEVACVECGKPLPVGSRFCSYCGAVQPAQTPVTAATRPAAQPAGRTVVGMALTPAAGRLRVLSGPLVGQQLTLGDELSLGREADNGLRLADERASRHHALIRRQGDHYVISDLGSSNGTEVNGVRIAQPTPLSEGDVILIGDTQLAFSAGS